MRPLSRRFARLLVLVCVFTAAAAPVERPTLSGDSSDESTMAGGEVRLRKLHLVRPDLIPYPIAYEVCC